MLAAITDHINTFKSSLTQQYSSKPTEPTTLFLANRRSPPLDGGQSTNIGIMWNLKHKISSPILYEPIIKTELKGYTAMDHKKFYNHIKMCLDVVNIFQECLLLSYQYINRHFEFE